MLKRQLCNCEHGLALSVCNIETSCGLLLNLPEWFMAWQGSVIDDVWLLCCSITTLSAQMILIKVSFAKSLDLCYNIQYMYFWLQRFSQYYGSLESESQHNLHASYIAVQWLTMRKNAQWLFRSSLQYDTCQCLHSKSACRLHAFRVLSKLVRRPHWLPKTTFSTILSNLRLVCHI